MLDFPLARVHPLMGLGGGWGLGVMKLTKYNMDSKSIKKTTVGKVSQRNGLGHGLGLRNVCHFDKLAKNFGDEIGQ